MKRLVTVSFVAVLGALAPTGLATTASAAAPTPNDVLLESGNVVLTSSTGQNLRLGLFIDHESATPGFEESTSLQVTVARGSQESHTWEFDGVTNKTFSYDSSTGKGSVSTGAQLKAYGALQLTMSNSDAATTQNCSSGGSIVTQPVSLSGTVRFATRSHAWGSLGDGVTALQFSGESAVVSEYGQVSAGCENGRLPRCSHGYAWSVRTSDGILTGGNLNKNGRRVGYIISSSVTPITDVAHAERLDEVVRQVPRPTISHPHHGVVSLLVHHRAAAQVSGSARLTSHGKAAAVHGSCTGANPRRWAARLTHGKHLLTVHQDIGGTERPRRHHTHARIYGDAPQGISVPTAAARPAAIRG